MTDARVDQTDIGCDTPYFLRVDALTAKRLGASQYMPLIVCIGRASMASPLARQLLRDERSPRVKRITALGEEVQKCLEVQAFDSALVMQFIELDTWAFLTRPTSIRGRRSFMWFIER
jgi:hypothetical protein